jgi:hypothetical protein
MRLAAGGEPANKGRTPLYVRLFSTERISLNVDFLLVFGSIEMGPLCRQS